MEIDANQELHSLAQRIVQALGAEWQYARQQPYDHRALLDGPGGMGLNLAWMQSNHGRLRVIGCWPKPVQYRNSAYVHSFDPYDKPAITVAGNREIDKIAKDIQRRLLPEYLKLWQEAVERKEIKLAEIEKLNDMLARLVEIPGVQEDKYKDGVRFGKYDAVHGDAEVRSDGTVSLMVRNLPFAVVCEVLERVLS